MQKEFMLYISNEGDAKAHLSHDQHLAFIKDCESYIAGLRQSGKLVAAQPIVREGCVLTKSGNEWRETPINTNLKVQVGYYHIRADNMEEAIAMAKGNPEFRYVPSASIEVRPVKTNEEETGFVYPKQPN